MLSVYVSSQGVHSIRDSLADDIFHLPKDKVVVRTTDVGGGFGMKLFMYPEYVATGFAAIGAGGVLLIGAGLPVLAQLSIPGALAALGFAALCLGLGFTQAIATLRDVLSPRAPRPTTPAETSEPLTAAMANPLG